MTDIDSLKHEVKAYKTEQRLYARRLIIALAVSTTLLATGLTFGLWLVP